MGDTPDLSATRVTMDIEAATQPPDPADHDRALIMWALASLLNGWEGADHKAAISALLRKRAVAIAGDDLDAQLRAAVRTEIEARR